MKSKKRSSELKRRFDTEVMHLKCDNIWSHDSFQVISILILTAEFNIDDVYLFVAVHFWSYITMSPSPQNNHLLRVITNLKNVIVQTVLTIHQFKWLRLKIQTNIEFFNIFHTTIMLKMVAYFANMYVVWAIFYIVCWWTSFSEVSTSI